MRILSTALVTLSFLAMPAFALAHDEEKTLNLDLDKIELPTEGEIQEILEKMPDFNALMDGFLKIAQDEDIRNSLEKVGDTLSKRADELGDIETRDNGMPDVNQLMEKALKTLSDEDLLGDAIAVLSELQDSVEENLDEDMLKPEKN